MTHDFLDLVYAWKTEWNLKPNELQRRKTSFLYNFWVFNWIYDCVFISSCVTFSCNHLIHRNLTISFSLPFTVLESVNQITSGLCSVHSMLISFITSIRLSHKKYSIKTLKLGKICSKIQTSSIHFLIGSLVSIEFHCREFVGLSRSKRWTYSQLKVSWEN